MLKTNMDRLVATSVVGEITHPTTGGYGLSYKGTPKLAVGMSGIAFNVKVGDPAFGWEGGDHVEPGASFSNKDKVANRGLNNLACMGNQATIISAILNSPKNKLKGAKGVVTGKHGGINHVIIYFKKKIIDNLCVGDRMQVKAMGVGLRLLDFPDIKIMNVGPELFKALSLSARNNKVRIPVAKIIPAYIMGSGLGATNSFTGDYDIQSSSEEAVKKYGLADLRLGDLVAVQDHDCSFGPRYQKGAITVGVVCHGASSFSAHGPGMVVLFTSVKHRIELMISKKANLANLLKLV